MKRLITVVACVLAFGLVGCSTQKHPDKYAERDYNIAGADKRPVCPGDTCPSKFGKFGNEGSSGDVYK